MFLQCIDNNEFQLDILWNRETKQFQQINFISIKSLLSRYGKLVG